MCILVPIVFSKGHEVRIQVHMVISTKLHGSAVNKHRIATRNCVWKEFDLSPASDIVFFHCHHKISTLKPNLERPNRFHTNMLSWHDMNWHVFQWHPQSPWAKVNSTRRHAPLWQSILDVNLPIIKNNSAFSNRAGLSEKGPMHRSQQQQHWQRILGGLCFFVMSMKLLLK